MTFERFEIAVEGRTPAVGYTTPARLLATATIGLAFGPSAIIVSSFGVLVTPLAAAFGWDRSDIGLALTFCIITTILMLPIAGWLVDRAGARAVLLPSIVLFGLSLAGMALLSGPLWQLYLGYVLIAIFGVGASTVTYSRLIVAWFTDRRGMALGISLAGTGIGVAICPLLVQSIISFGSWRAVYVGLGAMAFVALPFAWLWARYPTAARATANRDSPVLPLTGYSVRDALCTRAFALLAISFTLLGVQHGALASSLVPMMIDRGLPAMRAAAMASILGISLIVGRLLIGFLLDRLFAPVLLLGIIAIAMGGMAILLAGGTGLWLIVAIACLGFLIGADVDFLTYMISRYIGLRSFTLIFSIISAAFQFGIGIGPVLMGYSADATGGYQLALWTMMATTAAAAIATLFLGRYPRSWTDSR